MATQTESTGPINHGEVTNLSTGRPEMISHPVDIPDANFKPAPQVELADHVKSESILRQYLRPDGVFVKDLAGAFTTVKGVAKNGTETRVRTLTLEQANEHVKQLCIVSGRNVEVDFISKRPKAVPGWDQSIHVPGMDHEEQNAPKTAKGEDRLKIAEATVVQLQGENQALTEKVGSLDAKMDQVLAGMQNKAPTQPAKPLGQMNHDELDVYAAENRLLYRVSSVTLKRAEKVEDIEAGLKKLNQA